MLRRRTGQYHRIKFIFFSVLCLQFVVWFGLRHKKESWLNVPPPPSEMASVFMAWGDKQLAYRVHGVFLQNLGDAGGRVVALKDYQYDKLTTWFYHQDNLDGDSTFMPFLASFYFGAVEDPNKLRHIVDYLAYVGQRPGGARWRWLARAVYLARFKIEDFDLAYDLALKLAALPDEGQPLWTRQMPALVQNAAGNKKEALGIMLEILKSSSGKVHPNEINHTIEYICTRILDEPEKKLYDFCEDTN